MKQRRDIVPYLFSPDMAVNASLSLGKIYKRCRQLGLPVKRASRYQWRLQHKRAARRMKRGTVR